MTQHKLSFDSLMSGVPAVLPFEMTITLAPAFGPYATEPDLVGMGVTVTIARGNDRRSEHYPNRLQAWQRVTAIQARMVEVAS